MKKIMAACMVFASVGASAQPFESASALLPSATVVTGVAALSAPVVLLAVMAAGIEENLDSTTAPQTSQATPSTSTARR